VKTLFPSFEREKNQCEKRRIAEKIIDALSRHAMMKGEEQLVSPLLRARERKYEDDVIEALEEHHVVKMTLSELDKTQIDDERYNAKMTVLSESVRYHIEEEESQVFPRLQRITSGDERTRLVCPANELKEGCT